MPRARTGFDRLLLVALTLGVLTIALRPLHQDAHAGRFDEGSIAVCAIPTIVNELMASERFLEEREDLAEEFDDQRVDLEDRLADIRDRAQGMQQDDPAMGAIFEEFQTVNGELQRLRQEFNRGSAALQATQLADSYELARASALAVGDELGYEFVFASGSPDEDLNTTDTAQLLGQLARRPVIKFPEEHDITDDVRDDLNL